MKRWYSFIESFTPKIIYNTRTTNVVADALSRIKINNITNSDLEQSNSDQNTQHSAESSFENVIQETRKPLNQFQIQLILTKGRYTIHESLNVFDKTRHIIEFDTPENLIEILREYIKPNITVGIHCTLEDLYNIQLPLKNNFTNKFLYTKIFLQDVENNEDKAIIIEETHSRAHRGLDENYKQINRLFYWPNLFIKLKEYIKNCTICNENKYNRHPIKIPIGEALIPTKEGENLHIDIYYVQSLIFLTCIDAYSKFLVVKEIQNKLNIENKVMELLQQFPHAKVIMTDSEPSSTSVQFKSFAQRCGLTLHFADPRHSTSNGQVERAHSTLTELARCIKEEFNLTDYSEIIIRAAKEFNQSIHSTTNQKPFDILYNKIDHENISRILQNTQEKMLVTHNEGRKEKEYYVGQVVYEKKHGERNKLKTRYKKQVVKENLPNKVIINNRNRTIHKDNIKF